MPKQEKPKPPTPAEQSLSDAQALLQIWLRIKVYFMKATTEDQLSPEDEKAFLDLKSETQRLLRLLKAKLIPGLELDDGKVQALLKQSISIRHLRELPRMDRQLLINSWHQAFIQIAALVGALQFVVEGYRPPVVAKAGAGANIADLKGGASGFGAKKKQKKDMGQVFKIIFIVGLLGAAIFILGKRLQWF